MVLTGPGTSGLLIHDVTNVVIENLTLTGFGDTTKTSSNNPDDAISIQRSSRVWIDHNSLSRAGDKLIGANDGAREVTITWNHFSQQQQTLQVGSMSTANNDVDNTVTIAWNHFDHVGYRTPVVSYGKAHVFNNYMDTWAVSGVRSERVGQVYLEANIFQAGTAPKATIVQPGQGCNDLGSLCDARPGYLYDTGNLFLGRTLTESTGPDHVFSPSAAYSYAAEPALDRAGRPDRRGRRHRPRRLAAAPGGPGRPRHLDRHLQGARRRPRDRIRRRGGREGTAQGPQREVRSGPAQRHRRHRQDDGRDGHRLPQDRLRLGDREGRQARQAGPGSPRGVRQVDGRRPSTSSTWPAGPT